MTEKKKMRKLRAIRFTDEEWKVIQKGAKKGHQTPNEFLLSLALREAESDQEYINETAINAARQGYIIAAYVVKGADKDWVKKTAQEARELYPMPGEEKDHGGGDE